MPGYSLYRIGRSSAADIRIDDSSVSRLHAELIVTQDGLYYLTDCGSSRGSFIARGGKWAPVQQQYIGAKDRLLLGRHQATAQQLVSMLKDKRDNDKNNRAARAQTPSPTDDLPAGPVRRNIETGEIISDED